MTVARAFALVFGAIYVVVGVLGFIGPLVTGTGQESFIVTEGGKLLDIFWVNWFHNLAHLVIGVVGLVAAARTPSARMYASIVGIVYAALFVIGLFTVDRAFLGILPLNWADNILHLLSAVVALVVGFTPVGLSILGSRQRAVI
jgi:hypothetical protein